MVSRITFVVVPLVKCFQYRLMPCNAGICTSTDRRPQQHDVSKNIFFKQIKCSPRFAFACNQTLDASTKLDL